MKIDVPQCITKRILVLSFIIGRYRRLLRLGKTDEDVLRSRLFRKMLRSQGDLSVFVDRDQGVRPPVGFRLKVLKGELLGEPRFLKFPTQVMPVHQGFKPALLSEGDTAQCGAAHFLILIFGFGVDRKLVHPELRLHRSHST